MELTITNPENEQALIAHVLRHPREFQDLYEIIKPVDFGWDCYKWVWVAFNELYTRGLGIDTVTLGDELERSGCLSEFCVPGSKQFFGRAALSLLREVRTTDAGTTYAENVLDYSMKRQIAIWLSETNNQVHNGRRAPEIVADLQTRLESLSIHNRKDRTVMISDTANDVEADTRERAKDPRDVWGIPYAWPYLSLLTGGKQPGELTILAGEPKVGKSYWTAQDALETAKAGIPVYIWSGELKRKQMTRRMFSMLGVDGRRMRSGAMRPEDWDKLAEAKEILSSIPLYMDDMPMTLGEIAGVLKREKSIHGIQQVIVDYSLLIQRAGENEIERSGNVSREMKIVCNDLDLTGILVASVNKMGMDNTSETMTKSNVRGSGQQIHDADNVFLLTKYTNQKNTEDLYINPDRWDYIVSLHIAAGRDLDFHLPGGIINYERIEGTPCFKELKDVSKFPSWLPRNEAAINRMGERKDLE